MVFFFVIMAVSVLVYGYVGWSLLHRGTIGQRARPWGWGLAIALMISTPTSFVVARIGALDGWKVVLYWFAYTALAPSFMLVFTFLVRDGLSWVAGLSQRLLGRGKSRDDATDLERRDFLQKVNLGLLGLSGVTTAHGVVEARSQPELIEVEVPIRDLPVSLDGFRIVQITDLHIGLTIDRDTVADVVKVANSADADLLAITGDLVDGTVEQLRADTAVLSSLKARHGRFFVTGNHEYYWGAEAWIAEVAQLGFRVLNNAHEVVDVDRARLVVAGVTDYSAARHLPFHRSDPHAAVAQAPTDAAVRLLLAHQPRSAAEASKAGFDLQLSGHTHGGQFIPWHLFVWLSQPFLYGLHRMGEMFVYVSRGAGYWGPPVRVAAPPEIPVIILRAANSRAGG